MKMKFLIILGYFTFSLQAQNDNIEELKKNDFFENVNSIVLKQEHKIDVTSQNSMNVKENKRVLILNELGLRNLDSYLYYDPNTKIKNLQLQIFLTTQAKPLKVFKEKDFKDSNANDGFSVVTDSRVKSLDYQHLSSYPFIAEYSYEYTTSNTAQIPGFYPLNHTFENVISYNYTINFPENLGLKSLEHNFVNQPIEVTKNSNSINYKVTNLKFKEREQLAVEYKKNNPYAQFGLQKFNLEGVNGEVATWKDFGVWYHKNFILNQQELLPQTVQKVKELTQNISDPLQKAKILYEYMQSKTRYISVQLGVGGFKPFPAKYVDQKGIGDCKALSNYMMALLKAADVESFVTIVKAGNTLEDIREDLVSVQGNHMILALPYGSEYKFLECTSQTNPFAYQGDFTDNRNVIIIKPDGAIIYKTPASDSSLNKEITKGKLVFDLQGSVETSFSNSYYGIEYENYNEFYLLEKDKQNASLKSRYSLLKNIDHITYNFQDNKDAIVYKEDITLKTKPFIKVMGNQYIIPLNIVNPILYNLKTYKNRESDFYLGRGTTHETEFTIELPVGAIITFVPESKTVKSEFGEYNLSISNQNNSILLKRTFIDKGGYFSKDKYEALRKFYEEISLIESAKLTYKI